MTNTKDIAIPDTKYYQQMDAIANLHMQGYNPSQIAKETGIMRKNVIKILNDWKETLVADTAARDRAQDALNKMDTHFDSLIKKSYETLIEIQESIRNNVTPQNIQQKANLIRLIADLEAKRLDALQKSGLLDARNIGDQMAEQEAKAQVIIDILRNDLCATCKPAVMRKLKDVTGKVETVVVYES